MIDIYSIEFCTLGVLQLLQQHNYINSQLMILNEPLKLIEIANGKMCIINENFMKLKQLKGSVFPICMVGPVLTGKSTLLNKIIGKEMFKVGQTTMPTTKGAFAYVQQFRPQQFENKYTIFFDVQGFDDAFNQNNQQNDIQLLTLLMCTCKIVIYNSFGALDSKILQRIASLQQKLPSQLCNRPKIFFVQRDFSLKLINKQDQILKADQYIENCLRTFKDKNTVSRIMKIFSQQNYNKQQGLQSTSTSIKCCLLAHPGEKSKFRKSVNNLKAMIQYQLTQQIVKNKQNYCLSENFNYLFGKCVEMLSNKSSINQLFTKTEQDKQQEIKTWITVLKSILLQRIKKQIKANFPIPSQLLHFKYNKIINQGIDSLANDKRQVFYIAQVIGKEKIDEVTDRILQKLEQQNEDKIRNFVQTKIKQMVDGSGKAQLENIKMQEQQICKNLADYYPFIHERHSDLIKCQIYKNYLDLMKSQFNIVSKENNQRQKINQQKIEEYCNQIQKLKKSVSDKSDLILKLQKQMSQLSQKHQQMMKSEQEKQSQNMRLRVEAEKQLKSQHFRNLNSSQNGENILREIQQQLRQNVMYQKQYQKTKILNQEDANMAVIQSISKVLSMLEKDSLKKQQQQARNRQKLVSLEMMNKSLRQRLEQLVTTGNCADAIEKKYHQVQKQLIEKQKQIIQIANQKEAVIEGLRNQLRCSKQSITFLQSQVNLIRQKATDKTKTSQFMQKLLQSKQTLLQQTRSQLLSCIQNHKKQLTTLKQSSLQKQQQLSCTLSLFIVQNEQLSNKNIQLANKNSTIESKLKKQCEEKLLAKDKQIKQLLSSIAESEGRYEATVRNCVEMEGSMGEIFKQKDQIIGNLNRQIDKAENTIISISNQLQQGRQERDQLRQKYKKLQIQKQQLQNKIKRQQILTNNRIRHLQQNNQKLKVQLKQKQNTFDMMLLQLRSNNILTNNRTSTNQMIKQNSRQKYLKKIDHLQQVALKQLGEITNHVHPRQKSITRPSLHVRSECKDFTNCGQEFKYQNQKQGSKNQYKTDKKQSRPKLDGFSDIKSMHNNSFIWMNTNMNYSTGSNFKTVAKKI